VVQGVPIPGKTNDNAEPLKQVKGCINDIIYKHIIPLEKENGKAKILKKLKDAKKDFEQCGITNDYPIKKEVLEMFEKYIKEANGFGVREQYPEKSQAYSKKLKEKFLHLIQLIDGKIEAGDKKPGKKEEKKLSSEQQKKIQDRKQQDISKRDFLFWLRGEYQAYILQMMILLAILFALIYFLIYKNIRKHIDEKNDLLQSKLMETKNNLHNKISEAEQNLSILIGEVDTKVKQLILQLKYIDDERAIETSPAFSSIEQPQQTPKKEVETPPGQEVDEITVLKEEQKIPDKPEITIDFPVTSFRETWKNQILHEFMKNQEKIIEFSVRARTLEEIKEWFGIVGRRLQAYPQDTEKTFFINIYPSIKTLQSKLTRQEFDEFKGIFFKSFLETLDIEEFGQKGDQFNPERHHAYMKSGSRKGGEVYFIKKVDYPGYKMKYTSEILQKAYVEL
jgi:preprotein translocase subunit YajC